MKPFLLLAAVAMLSLSSCSPFASALRSPSASNIQAAGNEAAAMVQAMQMQATMQKAKDAASQKCDPILKREIGWVEEQYVGTRYSTAALATMKPIDVEGPLRPLAARVAIVGKVLAAKSSRPNIGWTFGVVQSDTPTSMHHPGGYVFVTTGLLGRMTNEAQLAGVLAHEIAHVTQRDELASWNKIFHMRCSVAVQAKVMLDASAPTDRVAAQFGPIFDQALNLDWSAQQDSFLKWLFDAMLMMQLNLGYERDAEFNADATAAHLVTFAGYDAAEYEGFVTLLGDQPHHPLAADRAMKLKSLREGELASFSGKAKPDLTALVAPFRPAPAPAPSTAPAPPPKR